MANPNTPDDDDVSTLQEIEARVLDAGDTSAPDTLKTDGWEIDDVGRVRGGVGNAMKGSAQGITDDNDGLSDNPNQLNGGLEARPDAEIKDHTDDPGDEDDAVASAPKKVAEAKPTREQKRSLPGRVDTLRQQLGQLSEQKRALAAEVEALARKRDEAGRFLPKDPQATEKGAGTDPKTVPATVASTDPGPRPKWADFDKDDKTYDEFLAATSDWIEAKFAAEKADVAKQIEDTRRQLSQRDHDDVKARVSAEFKTRMAPVRQAHDPEVWNEINATWDAVPVNEFIEDLVQVHPNGPKLYAEIGKNPDAAAVLASFEFTHSFFDAMQAMEDPTPVLAHLADNPDEFDKIVRMPSSRALVALGALDARLNAGASSRTVTRAPGPRPVSVSRATPPIRPVAGRRSSASPTVDPADIDFGPEYVATMNARERERRF